MLSNETSLVYGKLRTSYNNIILNFITSKIIFLNLSKSLFLLSGAETFLKLLIIIDLRNLHK